MRVFFLLSLLLLNAVDYSPTVNIPKFFLDTFKCKGLNKKYELVSFLKPEFLQADFNEDKIQDIAALRLEKISNKKGVLLLHGTTGEHFVFGAGEKAFGSDNYRWADKWTLYKKNSAIETQFDERKERRYIGW